MPSYNYTKKEPGEAPGKGGPAAHLTAPARLLAVLIVSIFSAELVVMVVLFLFKDMLSPLTVVLIDAPMLVLILSPVLYFFLFRPLLSLVQERREAERALLRERNRLRSAKRASGWGWPACWRRSKSSTTRWPGCGSRRRREHWSSWPWCD